ncbi:hypothetical protein [Candidatus Nitrotoga arctica]|uniref:Serine protease MucD/AlgY associated with sigma factor RpoE n=1 Tax=Candidatus Nitrotoga arctica TaxID=453162 RepID=A0ABN8ALQ3_9PROT|nr:hypothetical protein [Candidatus Nitrotoga arctica]CAG9931563.1 Serine protease precursor MucD/AlgY associated with sigma factor RpoE [Candidatus Nitrotoga arctica]
MSNAVANVDEVTVQITNKREFKPRILGIDKPFDVAVLKIEAQNLPTVKMRELG